MSKFALVQFVLLFFCQNCQIVTETVKYTFSFIFLFTYLFSHFKIAYSRWKEKIFEKSVTIEFQLTEKKTRIRHFMSMSLILFIFSDKLKKPNVIFSYYLHFPIILLCKVDYYIIAYQQSFAWKSTLTTLVILNS